MSQPTAKGTSKPKVRINAKKALTFLSGFIIIACGYLFINNLGKPAQGVVVRSTVVTRSTPQTDSWFTQSGKYISFSYPAVFTPISADKPSGVQLEIYKYVKRPWPFWNMSSAVSSLASGNLSDDASYNLRLVSPAKYTHEKWNINGALVDVFSSQVDGYEKAAFITHGGKLLTLDINSSDTGSSAKLDTIMKQVLGSVVWAS